MEIPVLKGYPEKERIAPLKSKSLNVEERGEKSSKNGTENT
jgi:hypothetical protein